jgi:hypothetical protein
MIKGPTLKSAPRHPIALSNAKFDGLRFEAIYRQRAEHLRTMLLNTTTVNNQRSLRARVRSISATSSRDAGRNTTIIANALPNSDDSRFGGSI